MCGRYSLGLPHDEIVQQLHSYNIHVGEWVGRDNFVPRCAGNVLEAACSRYSTSSREFATDSSSLFHELLARRHNIAPRSQAPVIRRRDPHEPAAGPSRSNETAPTVAGTAAVPTSESFAPSDSAENVAASQSETASTSTHSQSEAQAQMHPHNVSSPIILHTMKWGLVPHYSKHEDPSLKTINARCEALIEGQAGMWASIKGRKRCAVVCEGYYEWLKKGKERLPHFTRHKDGRLMLLAGLWDCTVLEGSTERLWTFTIVTTDASKEFSWLHDRQPVILPDETALNAWLDTSSGRWMPELSKLCAPYRYADHPLVCYQVPKEVGKIGAESPTFVQPIQYRKDGIQALFAKQNAASAEADLSTSPRSPSKVGIKRSASNQNVKTGGITSTPPIKKPKVEKVNAWDDDSDVEYIDDPAPRDAAAATKTKEGSSIRKARQDERMEDAKPAHKVPEAATASASSNPRASKTTPRKSRPSRQIGESSTKITSFFSKK